MFLSLLAATAFGGVDYPASDLQNVSWEVLEDSDDWVGCTNQGDVTWCRSISVVPAASSVLVALLEDFPGYVDVFDRVAMIRVLESDVIHVLLDMPFPFKSRDYVAKWLREPDNGDDAVVFTFESVLHDRAPALDDVAFRLPDAAGRWRLDPVGPNSTRVTYTWNAYLGGDIPTWGLPRARRTQGMEVMDWLTEAVR